MHIVLWSALQAFYCFFSFIMNYKPHYQLWTLFKFVDIVDPESIAQEHYNLCMDIWLKGRVYIGTEGISSTVSGTNRQLWAYEQYLSQHSLFCNIPDIHTKASDVDGHQFDRMIVRVREEIVALGQTVTTSEVEQYTKNISITEVHDIMSRRDHDESIRKDIAILDMRNTYEYKLGHFKGALPAGTINFREVKDMIALYKDYFKNKKKIIMYCTWGIRCDKLSVLMKKEWFDNIYGIDGGVVKYTNTYNDGAWLGNLYTFDGVISKQIWDKNTHTTIGRCIYTSQPTNHCANCRYSDCNARILCTPESYKSHAWFCSKECYNKAISTLMIKDIERDHTNYQKMRSELKKNKYTAIQKETMKTDYITTVARHLGRIVAWLDRVYQTSQQETIIDNNLLQNLIKK